MRILIVALELSTSKVSVVNLIIFNSKILGPPSESSQSKSALKSMRTRKFNRKQSDQMMNMINE